MAINIARRNAFAKTDFFKNYPSILEQFALQNVKLVNPFKKDDEGEKVSDPEQKKAVMECMMAQFVVRLFQTRAINGDDEENENLEDFLDALVQRYHDFRIKRIGGLEVFADSKYIAALNAYEQEMSNLIFYTLGEEVRAIEGTSAEGSFVEADYWFDILLALCANGRTYWPKWHLVMQEMILDHMQAFRFAIEGKPDGTVPVTETIQ